MTSRRSTGPDVVGRKSAYVCTHPLQPPEKTGDVPSAAHVAPPLIEIKKVRKGCTVRALMLEIVARKAWKRYRAPPVTVRFVALYCHTTPLARVPVSSFAKKKLPLPPTV